MKHDMVKANVVITRDVYYSISKNVELDIEVEAEHVTDWKGNDELDYDEPNIDSEELSQMYECQHYTITGLLDELVKLAKDRQSQFPENTCEWRKMRDIINDAQNWKIDEFFVE